MTSKERFRELGYSEESLKMLESEEGQLNAVYAVYGSTAAEGVKSPFQLKLVRLPRWRRLCGHNLGNDLEFSLYGRSEHGQISVALDGPEPGFDVHERGGQPAVSLAGGGPAFDVAGSQGHLAVDRFDAVGGPEAVSEQGHHAEAMQGEGLFESFVQAVGGRGIHQGAFRSYRLEGRTGLFAGVLDRRVAVFSSCASDRIWPDRRARSRVCATGSAGSVHGLRRPASPRCIVPWRRPGRPGGPSKRRPRSISFRRHCAAPVRSR